jgi:flagellar hook assembly protein FlgD
LPVAGRVNLDVFDIAGARIAKLFDGTQNAGLHTVQWNGRDIGGRAVSSGIYFCRLTFGKESIKRKMVLLK